MVFDQPALVFAHNDTLYDDHISDIAIFPDPRRQSITEGIFLNKKHTAQAGPTAPARGLRLIQIEYEENRQEYRDDN